MPVNSIRRTSLLLALTATGLVCAACSKDAKGSTPDTAPQQAAAGAKGGGKAGGGAAGGRTAPSITLAASDLATIAPSTIEAGVALTGDLRPIETIDVRSRIEGDLTSVLVREG